MHRRTGHGGWLPVRTPSSMCRDHKGPLKDEKALVVFEKLLQYSLACWDSLTHGTLPL